MPNVNTNFVEAMGNWKMEMLPFIASVAIAEGAAIYAVGDGTHSKVTASTGNFVGILKEPIAAADADYATSRKLKLVSVAMDDTAEAYFTVGAGTFTTADEGKMVKFNDEISLAVDTAGTQAKITKYIDATHGMCKLNRVYS
jgi:hypothetical protein